jgi:hypothetical protein
MPVGLQLIGRPNNEARAAIAGAIEAAPEKEGCLGQLGDLSQVTTSPPHRACEGFCGRIGG